MGVLSRAVVGPVLGGKEEGREALLGDWNVVQNNGE